MAVVRIIVAKVGNTGYQFCDIDQPFVTFAIDFVSDSLRDDRSARRELVVEHILQGLIRKQDSLTGINLSMEA